ncbi:DUF3887 domain-containing protein [candidate division WOR-3 bacterium]|nr:DUF3887 domain-containing protein [candidate division WOR-3 bacterium]
MKFKMSIVCFLLFFAVFSCSRSPQDEKPEDNQTLAVKFVELVDQEDYENAILMMDSAMNEVFGKEEMKQSWEVVKNSFGEIDELMESRIESIDDYEVVYLIYSFTRATVEVKVVFDSDHKIAGFFANPLEFSNSLPLPSYIDTTSFSEIEVEIGEGDWVLPGTYTVPRNTEEFPVVILVHGSGPNDRDETMGPNKPFRDMAWGLASAGIGVLRYDKRTKVYPEKMAVLTNELTLDDETIEDVLSAVDFLVQKKGLDSSMIFIAGHSLGGMAIPRIGSYLPRVGGFIIMSGNSRKLEDISLEQFNYIFRLDSLTEEESLFIDTMRIKISNLEKISEDTTISPEDLPFHVSQAYWAYLKDYDQVAEAKEIQRPVLILQGERDYQVTMVDFMGWKSALETRESFTFKSYPYLNHLYISGEERSTPDEYMIPGYVSQEVIQDIIKWIEDNN